MPGAPTATRLLSGRVKGVPSWGHGFGATPAESNPAGAALTGFCAGAAEFGHPGHPPLPGHGRTGLLCALNPVPAAIAAVVVYFGAVMIG